MGAVAAGSPAAGVCVGFRRGRERPLISPKFPWWGGGIVLSLRVFGRFVVFGSCLPNDHDGGVRERSTEGFGLQPGRLGELFEGAGGAREAGGIPGLGRELGEEGLEPCAGCPVLVRFVCALCCAAGERTAFATGSGLVAGARR